MGVGGKVRFIVEALWYMIVYLVDSTSSIENDIFCLLNKGPFCWSLKIFLLTL